MVKAAKMELLRALIAECLAAAADEIFRIAQKAIVEFEDDSSCSKWVVDKDRRLMDVARSQGQLLGVTRSQGQGQALDMARTRGQDVQMSSSEVLPLPLPGVSSQESPVVTLADDDDQTDEDVLIDVSELKDDSDQDTCLNPPKPFHCPVCCRGFSYKKTMVRHLKKHPEERSSYRCRLCRQAFCRKVDFIVHLRNHEGPKPFKCEDCGKSFEQKESLIAHRRKHAAGNLHQSQIETREGVTKVKSSAMTTKPRTDESSIKTLTPYNSSESEQESLQSMGAYQIQAVADVDEDSSSALPVDLVKPETAVALAAMPQETIDQVICTVTSSGEPGPAVADTNTLGPNQLLCTRRMGQATKLLVQFEEGTAEKPYKCPCCPKCFSLTKTLLRHVRIHTDDKQYECRFCSRNFCQKSELVSHTRVHTGERPYRCHLCVRSFTQNSNLMSHLKKHAEEDGIVDPRLQVIL